MSKTIYVDGTQVPTSNIKGAMTSEYQALEPSGTSNLFTGIAWNESEYKQFVQFNWYGTNGCWPYQSYDGGSHIGIMMVPTTQNEAYDWTQNVQNGVNLFAGDKMTFAASWESRIMSQYPQLPQLTTVQRERDALVFWGPYAGTVSQSGAYWVANPQGTAWVRTNLNPKAANWVDMVESLVGVH